MTLNYITQTEQKMSAAKAEEVAKVEVGGVQTNQNLKLSMKYCFLASFDLPVYPIYLLTNSQISEAS